jgi:glycogen synthase
VAISGGKIGGNAIAVLKVCVYCGDFITTVQQEYAGEIELYEVTETYDDGQPSLITQKIHWFHSGCERM